MRAPDLAGRRAILLTKRRVEAAKTLKAARVGDLNHGVVRVGEKTLGVRESVRLRERARRDAEHAFDRAPQLTIADAELSRQRRHTLSVERAGRNSPSGRVSKPDDSIDRSTPGNELRPTTQAGPESRLLRFDHR